MTAQLARDAFTRRSVLAGAGALTVTFGFVAIRSRADAAIAHPTDSNEVDSFLAVNGDGTVTLYCG